MMHAQFTDKSELLNEGDKMGMYHFNRLTTSGTKKFAKKTISKGRRRDGKRQCRGDESVTSTSKSKNLYYDSWLFS